MITRILLTLATLLMVSSHCMAATRDVVHLERRYEQRVSTLGGSTHPFDRGSFYGSEPTEAQSGTGSGRHRLVRIDAVSGRRTVLSDPGPRVNHLRFFLKDYVVAGDGPFNQTSIYARATFKRLGSKRLSDLVQDAIVVENTLMLLQRSKQHYILAEFELPGMRFVRESQPDLLRKLISARFWQNRIIGIGRSGCSRRPCPSEVVVAALDGTPITTIPFSAEGRPGRNCWRAIEDIVETRAVIRAGCGQYQVVDLSKGEVLYALPQEVDADFYDIAVSQDLLFARAHRNLNPPSGDSRGGPVRILDLETGRELALATLPDGKLLWSDDRLILRRPQNNSVLAVEVYGLDRTALRDIEQRTQAILAAARKAGTAQNVYAAIETIEAVSLDRLLTRPPSELEGNLFEIASDYGGYLAVSPRRVEEGADLLARLSAARPEDRRLAHFADVAARRARLFHADPLVRETALANAWTRGSQRPLAQSVIGATTVEFGAFSDEIYFHEDRVFIACWRCRKSPRVSVEILDRKTWSQIASLPTMSADEEKQENITGMAFESGRLFVSLGNRYPKGDDINFYVFDLETLEPIEARAIQENGATLTSGGGYLGICHCRAQRCRTINATRLNEVDLALAEEAVCVNEHRPRAVIDWRFARSGLATENQVVHAGARYFVTEVGRGRGQVFEFHRIDDETEPIRFPHPIGHLAWREIYFFRDGEAVLIGEKSLDTVRYHAFDLRTRHAQILIELPRHDFKGADTDGRALYLAFGRTVLALDMNSGDILDWADLFAARSVTDLGIEPKAIDRLLVDQGKLVVLTRSGAALLIDLERFHSLAGPDDTPFATTRRVLVE